MCSSATSSLTNSSSCCRRDYTNAMPTRIGRRLNDDLICRRGPQPPQTPATILASICCCLIWSVLVLLTTVVEAAPLASHHPSSSSAYATQFQRSCSVAKMRLNGGFLARDTDDEIVRVDEREFIGGFNNSQIVVVHRCSGASTDLTNVRPGRRPTSRLPSDGSPRNCRGINDGDWESVCVEDVSEAWVFAKFPSSPNRTPHLMKIWIPVGCSCRIKSKNSVS